MIIQGWKVINVGKFARLRESNQSNLPRDGEFEHRGAEVGPVSEICPGIARGVVTPRIDGDITAQAVQKLRSFGEVSFFTVRGVPENWGGSGTFS